MSKAYIMMIARKAIKSLPGIPLRTTSPESFIAPEYSNGNQVFNHPKLNNAKIVFKGKNNILFCESSDIILSNCKISFEGDNATMYISSHTNKKRKYPFRVYLHTNTSFFIGKQVNFHPNSQSYIVAAEGKNIIIGNDCLFSLGMMIRTSDGHAVYDSETKQRVNHAKSILIGDHVWVGQDVSILKGTRIGSGSIIGASSVTTGKTFPSNSSVAGIPAKILKQGVFFTKPNINGLNSQELSDIEVADTDDWLYTCDDRTLSFDYIDEKLSTAKTSEKKLEVIKEHLAGNQSRNRFYVSDSDSGN